MRSTVKASALLCLLLLLTGTVARGQTPATAEGPPNIVVVFVDDMGYGDLGVTGNRKVPTPNMDRLAQEGVRFTDFYVNAPVCSPSRVALTTGSYAFRWGIHSFIDSHKRNAARGMVDWLDPAAATLPRALHQAGYATGHFGKWHMGGGRDVGNAPLITEYGFDESVTQFEGLGERYLWHEGHTLSEQSEKLGRGETHWTDKSQTTRHYVDHAIDFIRRHRDGPFYLNLWPDDVHTDHLPMATVAAKYDGIARDEAEKDFFGVLDELDWQLGRLFNELDRLGIADETIVLLTGDNGPTDSPRFYRDGGLPPGSTAGFRGRKLSLYEGGIREPLLVRWPGHIPAGRVDTTTVIASIDLVPTLARLAGTSMPASAQIDGEDLGRAFFGQPVQRENPLYWFYINNPTPSQPAYRSPDNAIRDGKWKLLAAWDGSGAELYDLDADPHETTNVAASHPEIAERLSRVLRGWNARVPENVRRGQVAGAAARKR